MSRNRLREHTGFQPERPGNPNPPPKPDFLEYPARVSATDEPGSVIAAAPAARWEYRELSIIASGIPLGTGTTWWGYLDELNRLGRDGWELVTVFDRDPTRLVLKRQAQA